MLVDEQFRKCVAFLVVEELDEITGELIKKPRATTFFVSNPRTDETLLTYAITARHVIDKSRPNPLYIRVNTTSGGVQYLIAPQDDWISHPLTDVAVFSVELPSGLDLISIPFSMLASDRHIRGEKVGAGDEIFFVGLFSEHYGQEHNLPVVRFGNISLMPSEKLSVRVAEDMIIQVYGYLVEAMSWPGHSGSPVFIYFPFDREPGTSRIAVYPLQNPDPLSGTEQFKLLGLVCAHYPIEQEVKASDTIPEEQKGRIYEQSGMAVVIPAQGIIDTIKQ